MKHYAFDYTLSTIFDISNNRKLVRFFNHNGITDVSVDKHIKDPIQTAMLKSVHERYDFNERFKIIWSVCDFILKNSDGIHAENFLGEDGIACKIHIDKPDYYTINIMLKLSYKNLSETNSISLDLYNGFFLSELVDFVNKVLPRRKNDK